jgi:two-component system cell cycle response regulator CtrA
MTVMPCEESNSNWTRGVDEPELKIIDAFFCKLRKKLAKASQELHRDRVGRGYMLRGPHH